MQLVLPLDALCLGDHVGTIAVAVDFAVGEKSLVSARITMVSVGGRG